MEDYVEYILKKGKARKEAQERTAFESMKEGMSSYEREIDRLIKKAEERDKEIAELDKRIAKAKAEKAKKAQQEKAAQIVMPKTMMTTTKTNKPPKTLMKAMKETTPKKVFDYREDEMNKIVTDAKRIEKKGKRDLKVLEQLKKLDEEDKKMD